uniref:O-acyltransferase WSD1 C-terminal domain-containing protein n=1 Tax=Populus trichocarpa TaxID=3694 RepID=A0A2K1WQW9_POPTR
MIHVVSYANKFNIILSVDEGIFSCPHQFCDDLEESLKLIKDVVITIHNCVYFSLLYRGICFH